MVSGVRCPLGADHPITYLADKESTQQKFIGYGCLSSPRASEFFQRIGNEQTLSLKMAKACATHLEDGEFLLIGCSAGG